MRGSGGSGQTSTITCACISRTYSGENSVAAFLCHCDSLTHTHTLSLSLAPAPSARASLFCTIIRPRGSRYESFTAHDREWAFSKTKAKGYLASKTEILSHFADIAAACVAEHNVELLTMFNYEYDGHAVKDGKVVLTVNPTSAAATSGAAPVSIVATHLFRAEGFNVTIKSPFVLSVPATCSPRRARVHSLCPADVLTPQWSALMRYSFPHAPIYIIGSGKTAMDVIYHLAKREKCAAGRLHCIAGRGTW